MIELLDPLPEEEQNLLISEKDKPENREKLIVHNLKLIYWVIRRYYLRETRLEQDDLFQEGVFGLVNAIEKYDPNKGKFASFAIWDIRSSIQRALTDKGDIIRIPAHLRETLNSLMSVSKDLERQLYREPTSLEIASKMGISKSEVVRLQNIIKEPVSLNSPIGTEGLTLEGNVQDPLSPGYEEVEDRVYIQQFKNNVKPYLTDLEFKTITLFYGLDSPEYSIGEIAQGLKEEARKVSAARKEGLRKLRRSKAIAEIKRELDENTIYITSKDYTKPKITGEIRTSPVEIIAMQREKKLEELYKRRNFNREVVPLR